MTADTIKNNINKITDISAPGISIYTGLNDRQVKRIKDRIVMQNPGSIRTGKNQRLRGGISDPRNKALMKM